MFQTSYPLWVSLKWKCNTRSPTRSFHQTVRKCNVPVYPWRDCQDPDTNPPCQTRSSNLQWTKTPSSLNKTATWRHDFDLDTAYFLSLQLTNTHHENFGLGHNGSLRLGTVSTQEGKWSTWQHAKEMAFPQTTTLPTNRVKSLVEMTNKLNEPSQVWRRFCPRDNVQITCAVDSTGSDFARSSNLVSPWEMKLWKRASGTELRWTAGFCRCKFHCISNHLNANLTLLTLWSGDTLDLCSLGVWFCCRWQFTRPQRNLCAVGACRSQIFDVQWQGSLRCAIQSPL